MAWRHYQSNKYGNHKVTVDGETFDSKREANRWLELKMLEKAGAISHLRRQHKFELIPAQYEEDIIGPRGGHKKGKLLEKECSYIADFTYWDEAKGEFVVEDTKGFRTADYVIKRKLMLWLKELKIVEV